MGFLRLFSSALGYKRILETIQEAYKTSTTLQYKQNENHPKPRRQHPNSPFNPPLRIIQTHLETIKKTYKASKNKTKKPLKKHSFVFLRQKTSSVCIVFMFLFKTKQTFFGTFKEHPARRLNPSARRLPKRELVGLEVVLVWFPCWRKARREFGDVFFCFFRSIVFFRHLFAYIYFVSNVFVCYCFYLFILCFLLLLVIFVLF